MSTLSDVVQSAADVLAGRKTPEQHWKEYPPMHEAVRERIAFGEKAVGDALGGVIGHGGGHASVVDCGIHAIGYAQSRSFPRSEVLTILRALKADTGVVAGKEALDRAIRVFEGME